MPKHLKDRLTVVFLLSYNIKTRNEFIQHLILYGQISIVGKESSGTGNTKFAKLTTGTLDSAKVEMREMEQNAGG